MAPYGRTRIEDFCVCACFKLILNHTTIATGPMIITMASDLALDTNIH